MQESKLIQSGMMEVTTVAEAGYRGLMAGQRVIVPGIFNQITAFLPRLLPRRLVTRMVMQAQGRVGH